MRLSSTRARAAAVALAIVLLPTVPGCGGRPAVDRSALYSPESLAQELAFRYRGLKPESRNLTRPIGRRAKPEDRDRARRIDEKVEQQKGGGAEVPKKRAGPPTLDDVMTDIDAKLDKVPGEPRADSCRRMIEALEKDASLSAEDRALLAGHLKEMGAS
jgi:hypothetical protein